MREEPRRTFREASRRADREQAAVALLATAYNAGLKRTFPADVLCLGGARTANLALGFAAGGYGGTGGMVAYGAGYLVVIACVTGASRAEDLAEPPTRRLALLLSFLPQALVYGVGLVFAEGWRRGLPFVAPAALQAAALRSAMIAGTREAARQYVFRSLLLLFAFHACVLWAADRTDGLIGVSACAAATFLLLARR